jgi:hypothetical protein
MAGKLTHDQAVKLGKKGGQKNKGRVSPTTAAKIDARAKLRELIEADMIELHAAWKDSALGHFVQVKLPTGMTKVYKKSPNAIAIKDMFERAFGKPDQKVEAAVTVESQADMAIAAVLATLNQAIETHEQDDGQDSDVADDGAEPPGEGNPA